MAKSIFQFKDPRNGQIVKFNADIPKPINYPRINQVNPNQVGKRAVSKVKKSKKK